ncbi:hypothetical protein KAZ01_01420 [Candidatus Gracilibacteria bacterium]|nr:hypothetical protein [Candidatus Gracilibacteria bacterium]
MPLPTVRDIEKLEKPDLLKTLKLLKKFRLLQKDIGNKSKEIFHSSFFKTQKFVVEYFPTINKNDLENFILNTFKLEYGVDIAYENILWKENQNLKGGIRLFIDDDMVDISFEKINNKLYIWSRKGGITI